MAELGFSAFLFLLFVRLCHPLVWRYSNKNRDSVTFTTKDNILLEYLGNASNIRWHYPEGCIVQNDSAAVTTLTCDLSGEVPVYLLPEGHDQNSTSGLPLKYLSVHQYADCFEWYLARVKNSSASEFSLSEITKIHARVWIVDFIIKSAAEKNYTATEPSRYSQMFTDQFRNLGQTPSLRFSHHGDTEDEVIIRPIGYSSQKRYWEFEFQISTPWQVEVCISGKPVALYDCKVLDMCIMLPEDKYKMLSDSPNTQALVGNKDVPQIVQDPCSQNIAAVITSTSVLITQDNFRSYFPVYVPKTAVTGSGTVDYAAFTQSSFVVVTENQVLEIGKGNDTVTSVQGGPASPIVGLKSRDWCNSDFLEERTVPVFAVWTRSDVYLKLGRNSSLNKLSLPFDLLDELSLNILQVNISDVAFHFAPHHVGVVLVLSQAEDKKVLVAEYNWISSLWSLMSSLVHIPSQPGEEHGLLTVYKCSADVLTNGTEYISQVLINTVGEILIELSNRVMFYSKTGLKEILEIDSGEIENSSNVLWFDSLNRLFILNVEGSTIRRRMYPLENEVLSSLHPAPPCPYRHFVHSIKRQLYSLDMGEVLPFWTLLVFSDQSPGTVELTLSNLAYLKFNQTSTIQHAIGVYAENKTINFYHDVNFYGVTNYTELKLSSPGITCFEVKPSNVHLVCPEPTHKTAQYDWDQLGCPIKIHNTENFLPHFHLYDGDDFVRPVTANFIIWEENGRTDFSYTATMKQAGCEQEAQTWQKMKSLTGSNHGNQLNMSTVWGPHNYQSCFDTPAVWRSFSGPYQILNSSGISSLSFTRKHDGIYVFHVKIVEPNFSYCDLEARFAVSVYGADPTPDLTTLGVTLVVICMVILISLVTSYVQFNKAIHERYGIEES